MTHGSITSGNPFNRTYASDTIIYVPADSYTAYSSGLGVFGSYVMQPDVQSYALMVAGATINGEAL